MSPDGRWVAYTSNETGRSEGYVQPYPRPGPKTPVSVGGGNGPVWRGDGKRFVLVTGPELPNRIVVELNVLGSSARGAR